jgi:hypothetical protein
VSAIDDPAATARLTEPEAISNVRVVLELCASGRLRCSEKTRRPTAASVTSLALLLAAGDFYPHEPIAAYAWPLLVQAGNLAELAGGRLQLTTRGRAALRAPSSTTIRGLWQRWVSRAVIDELTRVEAIKGQRSATVLTSAKTRRQTVANALGTCAAGEWVSLDDLFGRMQRGNLNPTIARNESETRAASGGCTSANRGTAAWATPASTTGPCSKGVTHSRCSSSTPPRSG